jgi:pyruvate formate lyase activating enzyme
MQINGFNKTTLLDYPKHIAATVFIGGCNMRCPFCHNASLVEYVGSQPAISIDEVLDYLKKRKGILEGVCVTGGEPTLYPELPAFISEIKALGFKVKLDTNGTNPAMLKNLSENRLIDYVAMDIKNSKSKYPLTTGMQNIKLDKICDSVSFLLTSQVEYEFRTTIVKETDNG